MFTKESISGVVRHILTFGGGIAANAGLVSTDELQTIVGGLVALVGVVWSVLAKK